MAVTPTLFLLQAPLNAAFERVPRKNSLLYSAWLHYHGKAEGCTAAHKLPVEEEYLLVLMKLRMGVSVVDLGERFNIAENKVNNIFLTWINYMYVTLGSIKIWSHRDTFLQTPHLQNSANYITRLHRRNNERISDS